MEMKKEQFIFLQYNTTYFNQQHSVHKPIILALFLSYKLYS